jgi:hypothetical protein
MLTDFTLFLILYSHAYKTVVPLHAVMTRRPQRQPKPSENQLKITEFFRQRRRRPQRKEATEVVKTKGTVESKTVVDHGLQQHAVDDAYCPEVILSDYSEPQVDALLQQQTDAQKRLLEAFVVIGNMPQKHQNGIARAFARLYGVKLCTP